MINHKPMDERDYDVILALAANRMQAAPAAKAAYFHPRSIWHRIDKIKHITGLDPLDFYDLCKLVAMVKEAGYERDYI